MTMRVSRVAGGSAYVRHGYRVGRTPPSVPEPLASWRFRWGRSRRVRRSDPVVWQGSEAADALTLIGARTPAYPVSVSASRLRRVAVLVLEGAKPLDVGIPAQVFTTRASMPYEVRLCGAAPGLVTGGDGLSYHVAHGLDALAWADIVFIPGYRFPDRDDPPQAVVDALIAAHDRGARLAAISTGAFALAATGLLDGRRATTHWHYARALVAKHPLVEVDENVLFVDEGSVLTSAAPPRASTCACTFCVETSGWPHRTTRPGDWSQPLPQWRSGAVCAAQRA